MYGRWVADPVARAAALNDGGDDDDDELQYDPSGRTYKRPPVLLVGHKGGPLQLIAAIADPNAAWANIALNDAGDAVAA